MTQPASVPTNGTVSVIFVEAIADPSAPTLVEITALTSLDISCYLTGDGWQPDTSENNIEDARLCSKQVYEQPGDYTDTAQIVYVFNPASPADDEAHLALPLGTVGFLVVRWGVDADQPYQVGDMVDVYPVTFGVQKKQTPARNGVHKIMQKPFVTGAVQRDVLVA